MIVKTFVNEDFETMFKELIHLEDKINDWIVREEKDYEVLVQIGYLSNVDVWEGVVECNTCKRS